MVNSRFEVQEVALEAVQELRPLVARIAKQDRGLADQLRRAASSVVLNVAEANGCRGGNRRVRFSTALGSARESRACLDLAVAWGYVASRDTAPAHELYDRTSAMLYRLIQ